MSETKPPYISTQTAFAGHAIPYPPDIDALLLWANVTRRLITAATQNRDAIITISVIIDERGKPVRWTSPRRDSLEPHRR